MKSTLIKRFVADPSILTFVLVIADDPLDQYPTVTLDRCAFRYDDETRPTTSVQAKLIPATLPLTSPRRTFTYRARMITINMLRDLCDWLLTQDRNYLSELMLCALLQGLQHFLMRNSRQHAVKVHESPILRELAEIDDWQAWMVFVKCVRRATDMKRNFNYLVISLMEGTDPLNRLAAIPEVSDLQVLIKQHEFKEIGYIVTPRTPTRAIGTW